MRSSRLSLGAREAGGHRFCQEDGAEGKHLHTGEKEKPRKGVCWPFKGTLSG